MYNDEYFSPEYIGAIANKLQNFHAKDVCFEGIKNFPLIEGKQCLYIIDWKASKILYYDGVKEMLGYDDAEFNLDLILNYFHPDDIKFVNRIIKGAVEHSVINSVTGKRPFLNLTFRVQKKDGTYLKVLRQSSAYQVDKNGKLLSNFSILTDISFINNNNKVEWEIFTNTIDAEAFKKNVFQEFQDFFTLRELDIIQLIHQGLKTKDIAEKLCVSSHTIATHRKNILSKSNCHSSNELLDFCNKNGIL
jgi:DNA-binding CsgD family transcriptional regulator